VKLAKCPMANVLEDKPKELNNAKLVMSKVVLDREAPHNSKY
jgi:hypothetical protein